MAHQRKSSVKRLLGIACVIVAFPIYAKIDNSAQSTLAPSGQALTLKSDFFIPHIPYAIICQIKNDSDETAFVNAAPGGAHELIWKKIQINNVEVKNFKTITKLKPHSVSMIKVTGFELNGSQTQVFFSVTNMGYRFNSSAPLTVRCETSVE